MERSSLARVLAALAMPALLATGCADPDQELAVAAQAALVGTPKSSLIGCAGVPDRSASAGGKEFLTYSRRGLESVPRGQTVMVDGYDRKGRHVVRPRQVTVFDLRERACEATFTLGERGVEQVVYGEGASPAQCAAVVRACMAPAAP
ncbi:hypothetical protein [Arenibaculum pallidiluteum]|uniref:hypothetical protein n=1 Tax=Arenibaculum pallidiluteum TaxID=2812559 RepID=UPI001A96E91A|nr:hypothetical protein [Arenibaculum pallidiluteum]